MSNVKQVVNMLNEVSPDLLAALFLRMKQFGGEGGAGDLLVRACVLDASELTEEEVADEDVADEDVAEDDDSDETNGEVVALVEQLVGAQARIAQLEMQLDMYQHPEPDSRGEVS